MMTRVCICVVTKYHWQTPHSSPRQSLPRTCLPKFDEDLDNPTPPLPPKLTKWFDNLRKNDEVFAKVYDKIMDPLVDSWEAKNHRWDSIWLAGLRDTAPATIFDKNSRWGHTRVCSERG